MNLFKRKKRKEPLPKHTAIPYSITELEKVFSQIDSMMVTEFNSNSIEKTLSFHIEYYGTVYVECWFDKDRPFQRNFTCTAFKHSPFEILCSEWFHTIRERICIEAWKYKCDTKHIKGIWPTCVTVGVLNDDSGDIEDEDIIYDPSVKFQFISDTITT